MGFTDEDFGKAEAVNSNTQLYKQAGNSIVKPVLENIFRCMNIQGIPRESGWVEDAMNPPQEGEADDKGRDKETDRCNDSSLSEFQA